MDEIEASCRVNLFGGISNLADYEMQQMLWLDPIITNPAFTYVEYFENFYDISGGDYDVIDPKNIKAPFFRWVDDNWISKEEHNVIWDVHLALALDKQPDDYDHQSILVSSSWKNVVTAASIAKNTLMRTARNQKEMQALTGKIDLENARKPWP